MALSFPFALGGAEVRMSAQEDADAHARGHTCVDCEPRWQFPLKIFLSDHLPQPSSLRSCRFRQRPRPHSHVEDFDFIRSLINIVQVHTQSLVMSGPPESGMSGADAKSCALRYFYCQVWTQYFFVYCSASCNKIYFIQNAIL